MPILRKDFINAISQKIYNEELSVFLGAGVSAPLGIPSWKELLTPLAKTLDLDIEKQYDYYSLAQYYVNKYGATNLKKHINKSLMSFNSDNIALEKILKLNPCTIWTTNFDEKIETILHKNMVRYQAVNSDKGLATTSTADAIVVYKLNGDCHNLENLIITTEDWEMYENTHPTMITFLKKELVSNTFLFYGYSFNDNLIKSVLSGIKRFVGDACNIHYSIQKGKESKEFEYQLQDLEVRYHVKTLLVDSYDEVPKILDDIMNQLRKHNIFISGRMGDVTSEIEDQACRLGTQLSAGLLNADYNICTGMGRKIGYFIASSSIQYLLEKGYHNIERHLKIRPFDDTMDWEKRSIYRKNLIEDNNAVIFMYGHSSNGGRSKGMWEEYQIAKKLKKIIIPIGSTGYESMYIWEDVNANLTEYPYLETSIADLQSEKNPIKITALIIKILNLVSE